MAEMFGDTERYRRIAEELLEDYSLEDILELNDLSEVEVLEYLIGAGLIYEPEWEFPEF